MSCGICDGRKMLRDLNILKIVLRDVVVIGESLISKVIVSQFFTQKF